MTEGGRADSGSPAVRMRGISKTFGGIHALDNVDLTIERGEIHAVLGENGAGKSTILKILRGVLKPDSGRIEIDGHGLANISPETARRAGVAMIFQEMSLVPTLTVAQNIFLNHEARSAFGLVDDREAVRQAKALFEMLGVDIDPTAELSTLGTGQRQLTEIVKAISQHARILILDEPTSALSAGDVERLFAFLRRLRSDGVAVIYVSHRMDEIMRIADRATILRDGRRVITAAIPELTLEAIITYIVGRRVSTFSDVRGAESVPGELLIELVHVSGIDKPRDVSLKLRRGEVVGVAGLLGSGRSSLARVICGLDPLSSGAIRVSGRPITMAGADDAMANGIVLVPEDRLRQGVIVDHSVASNICLPVLDRLSKLTWVSNSKARGLTDDQIERQRIKTVSRDEPVRSLSGGNQQKVVLAKWMAADPDALVLDEPTAGIDIGSKSEIIVLIRDLARAGKAVILISSELSELLAVSDRILLMSEGRVTREIDRAELVWTGDVDDASAGLSGAERRLQVMLQQAA